MEYLIHNSEPILLGDREITLYSRALQIRFPGHSGGIVWNRPVFLSVKTSNGHTQVVPIRDTTRLVQLVLLGACFVMFSLITAKHRNKDTHLFPKRG